MYKLLLVKSFVLLIFISCLSVYASSGDGGDSGAFLKNGIGVRPISMGKAFVGIADDTNAGYWNPAGLAKLNNLQASFMYSNPMNYDIIGGAGVKDIGYHTISMAYPTRFGSAGLNIAYLSVGDIEVVKDATGPTGEKFQDKELGLILSYANSITDQVNLGLNLKLIRQNIWEKQGSGMGMDLGSIYEPIYNLKFGLAIQNLLTPKITLLDETDSLPRKLMLGASYKLLDDSLLVATSIDKSGGRSAKFHLGTEYSPMKDLSFRAGYTSDTGEISTGLGVRISFIQLDYGFGFLKLGSTHRISVTIRL